MPRTYLDPAFQKLFETEKDIGKTVTTNKMTDDEWDIANYILMLQRTRSGGKEADLASCFKDTLFLTVYMLVAAYSIGFAQKQYIKANEQQGVLKYYLSNHLWFLVVCIIVWSIFLSNNFYNMYLNSHTN